MIFLRDAFGMRSGFAMQDLEKQERKNSSAKFPRSTSVRLLPKGRKNSHR